MWRACVTNPHNRGVWVLCVCSVHVVQSILSSVSDRLVHSRRISRRWGGRVYVVCSSSVIELHCVMYIGSLCV